MRLITAIIRPQRLAPVRDALIRVGVQGMTLTEVKGFGQQAGSFEEYQGVQYRVEYVPKLKIELVVTDDKPDDTVNAIIASAHTGHIGDGKIWITGVEAVYRIRTGDRDETAV
ncbi:MAG: P-II family nitrogen regulator [Dehalococcoidia bacterium]|nr:P-II family nitrogen regulator [Dehalococcoidia bacterium]